MISLIIPVYDVSAYIERCIRSVMSQTYGDIECIIVDDATPDDSIEKCKQLIQLYDGPIRFLIVRHENNRGLSAARNTGILQASGEWVLYLDGDDELTSDCLEKLTRPVLLDDSIELVLGNSKTVVENVPSRKRASTVDFVSEKDIMPLPSVRDYVYGVGPFPVTAWAKLIKRSFLIKNQLFFREGLFWEDNLWTFYLTKCLNHLYIIPDVVYLYRKRPNSITTGITRRKKSLYLDTIYSEIARNFTLGEEDREARYYLLDFCNNVISLHKSRMSMQTARLFSDALNKGNHPKEKIFLSTSMFLATSMLGRRFYYLMIKAWKLLKGYETL